jgi:hypothetical protein
VTERLTTDLVISRSRRLDFDREGCVVDWDDLGVKKRENLLGVIGGGLRGLDDFLDRGEDCDCSRGEDGTGGLPCRGLPDLGIVITSRLRDIYGSTIPENEVCKMLK